jgi:hypothetical protein
MEHTMGRLFAVIACAVLITSNDPIVAQQKPESLSTFDSRISWSLETMDVDGNRRMPSNFQLLSPARPTSPILQLRRNFHDRFPDSQWILRNPDRK